MKNEFKLARKYVTFVPTGKEFPLNLGNEGPHIGTTDKVFLQYDVDTITDYYGTKYYRYTANTEEKLKLFTNAHRLYYVANYKGQQFAAGVSKVPMVTLFSNTANKPNITGFVNFSKSQWIKEVDISEVEIIPIIEHIDLSKHLRKK